jgi:hypothetical protein
MNAVELFGVVSGAWGMVGVGLGSMISAGMQRASEKKAAHTWRTQLETAAKAGDVALCVRIGGRNAVAPDVARYLRKSHPAIETLLSYEAPEGATLDDPNTARRITDDLIELLGELGKRETATLHLFYGGTTPYPLLLGALLGNTTPVKAYAYDGSGGYRPLYDWNPKSAYTRTRATKRLGRWETLACSTPDLDNPPD